ncbi:MAG: hypothetical protein U0841_26075 [Chloroflexia bacterium]
MTSIQERGDGGHVHQGHVADGGVEAARAEGEELGFVGGVGDVILDLEALGFGAGAGAFDEAGAEVGGDDGCAEGDEAAGEDAVAATDVGDGFAGLDVEQALGGGADEVELEAVAFGHAFVPEVGFLVPDGLGFAGE